MLPLSPVISPKLFHSHPLLLTPISLVHSLSLSLSLSLLPQMISLISRVVDLVFSVVLDSFNTFFFIGLLFFLLLLIGFYGAFFMSRVLMILVRRVRKCQQ